jgi:hypothetical protein
MQDRVILIRQMNRTAAALAAAPVRVQWDYVLPDKRGYCTCELYNGAYIIGIDARLPLGELYETFLHEAGHAYINGLGLSLPDREIAAWELAGIWANWVSDSNPVNIFEAVQYLARLQRYHLDATDKPRRFTAGKNAGRILPGVKTQ